MKQPTFNFDDVAPTPLEINVPSLADPEKYIRGLTEQIRRDLETLTFKHLDADEPDGRAFYQKRIDSYREEIVRMRNSAAAQGGEQ